jgi:hypothetical protein
VVTESYTFPAGIATAPSGGTAWDIVGLKTTLSGQFGNANGNSYDTLRVDVTFSQNVANALPAPGQMLNAGTQLGIDIALDTDGNPNTGNSYGCSNTGAEAFEYLTDPGTYSGRLADGNYTILYNGGPISSGGENPPSEAMVSISGNTMSETFFLTAIGVQSGKMVPKIGIAVSAFNGGGLQTTDCVPASPTTEVFTT